MSTPFTVFLVDDDESVLRSLGRLLKASGYAVESYLSPLAFLAAHDPKIPGCAVLDVNMPGLDGLQLQAALGTGPTLRPIVFLTGAGDIPTSVRAMRAGAIDFLTKPVDHAAIVDAIERAAAADQESRRLGEERAAVAARIASLTPREREVLELVVKGLLNKQIAHELGASIKTIKVHRGRVMDKMGVRAVADLVRMTALAGAGAVPEGPTTKG